METSKLKKFAQYARRSFREVVESKLQFVLADNSLTRRENPQAIKDLEDQIKQTSKEQVIEKVSYIWFNRFCALRFMDVNRYTRINIVSPADESQFQPEILTEAKMGHIDENMVPDNKRQQIIALLNGTAKSNDPQSEAYRLLVVAACNYFNKTMPYLFEKIADYTELLMPDDLLSGNSILAYTREAMTLDVCEDVEVIGWLYQFYISEKKDEVFEGLKKNKKITHENIPAATQLFTPHYIVRYLVENSLGRLWMLNHPNSTLIKQMEYYIKPEQVETDFLKINSPEEIKICDPACGSGHMLTYAFDLLYKIYEEAGYESNDIPEKILTNNLFGIEIDERAAELASFALTMKARAKQRRFFGKQVQPNICAIENIQLVADEFKTYMNFAGLLPESLKETILQFEEANNYGSLVRPKIKPEEINEIRKKIESNDKLKMIATHHKIMKALKQADYLSPKYHVVVTNPPYMGGGGMNPKLADHVKKHYPDSKSDLFAVFIERNLELTKRQGQVAMITMQSWMFLSSYEKLREKLLNTDTILSMAHLGTRAFDSIGGEVVSTTAFVIENAYHSKYKGSFIRLTDKGCELEKDIALIKAVKNPECGWFYEAYPSAFKKIPLSPIAYWFSEKKLALFSNQKISQVARVGVGMQTGENSKYIRYWFEVNKSKSELVRGLENSYTKWFPCNKGGEYRKWYGNCLDLINWENNGWDIKNNAPGAYIRNEDGYFKPAITWSRITTNLISFRFVDNNCIHNDASCFINADEEILFKLLDYLNTPIMTAVVGELNPTLNLLPGQMNETPFLSEGKGLSKCCINIARKDWDSYETSWNFTKFLLLQSNIKQSNLKESYIKIRDQWHDMTIELKKLEEENNDIFIKAYELEGELDKEVPLSEITLTCNPHYRYGNGKSEEELERLLLQDTIKEFISYAVGCMFGRYSLDKPGLILTNQGETIEDYLKQIKEPLFMPDEDNVIPILDGDWFPDDISERFKSFLKASFGENNYEENLTFIESAIGSDIRKYFIKDFYNDHVKTYKKRPIYWLFSSPKCSFNVLIYMHRYNRDTVNVILNDYLRDFRTKLCSQIDHFKRIEVSAGLSPAEKTKALKEIEKLTKIITEIDDYERDILYPLATERKEIDLDDGIKVNYLKFGKALKPISGLSDK